MTSLNLRRLLKVKKGREKERWIDRVIIHWRRRKGDRERENKARKRKIMGHRKKDILQWRNIGKDREKEIEEERERYRKIEK